MDNSHDIKDLDLLYSDAKKLVTENVLEKIDGKILSIFDKTIDSLIEQWHGEDAAIQINKLIDIRNILVDNRDIIGNVGVYISMLAKNYRDAQNTNGMILPSFTQLTFSKVEKMERINNAFQALYMNSNIRSIITDLNGLISILDDLDGVISKIASSIFDNWVQNDENRNYALKMFEKYSENSINIVSGINDTIKCINKSIDNYNASKNKINSMPSLESMFAGDSQNVEKKYSSEEITVLDSIEKNIDSYKKLSDDFNDRLVSEVKKDLINKGIIE